MTAVVLLLLLLTPSIAALLWFAAIAIRRGDLR